MPTQSSPSFTIVLLTALLFPIASYADTADLLGRYWFPERNGQIEIYQEGGHYFGKVISFEIEGQKDENNPDPALRDQPLVGSLMFADFTYNPEQERWEDGTIYDPESGDTYKCRLWFEDSDLSVLHARGYIGLPMLGRTALFTRVSGADNE